VRPMPIPKMRQLFGTDGIRGIAGEYPLDRRTVYAIGRALGQRLAERDTAARVLIGQDTRESSGLIGAVLAAGLEAAPVQVVSAGIITTPGIAYLTRLANDLLDGAWREESRWFSRGMGRDRRATDCCRGTER